MMGLGWLYDATVSQGREALKMDVEARKVKATTYIKYCMQWSKHVSQTVQRNDRSQNLPQGFNRDALSYTKRQKKRE